MVKIDNIAKIREYFKHSKHPILLAYLFGSQTTGLIHPESDYDIALLLKEVDPKEQMRLYRRILFELGGIICRGEAGVALTVAPTVAPTIDLLLLNGDESELACKAVCFGKLLYSADEKIRVDYQTRMLKSYFEHKDFKRIHQYYLRKAVLSRKMGKGDLSMIDRDVINARIGHIRRMLAYLKPLCSLTLEEFERDEDRYHAALYRLQTTIEAISDIANHIHAALNLKPAMWISPSPLEGEGRGEGYQLIILAESGVISRPLAEPLAEAVEMRNIIVHGYLRVALPLVYDAIQNDLRDIEEFCREVLLYIGHEER